MKIRPVGAELLQAARRTDRQTKLTVAFRNSANASKNETEITKPEDTQLGVSHFIGYNKVH
jgi:hypothetical protein